MIMLRMPLLECFQLAWRLAYPANLLFATTSQNSAMAAGEQQTSNEWAVLEQLGVCEGLCSKGTRASFVGKAGVRIEYAVFEAAQAKKHVVLLTGWDESFLKYAEVSVPLVDARMISGQRC
jgi:hypothetical protein